HGDRSGGKLQMEERLNGNENAEGGGENSVQESLTCLTFSFSVVKFNPSSAGSDPLAAGRCCPDSWVGYGRKCYYFSEAERDWNNSQNNCSSFGASLAEIDTPQEMAFIKRHKDLSEHWIGLRREPGQVWKWTNGTEFNHWFRIRGGGDCAYLNDEKGVSSSRCYMEREKGIRKLYPEGLGKHQYP
uniref:C-type lectin domain-containing protein n=1 Tax=Chelonoidis abingdonii TaxID=106734 RepID=A0A8C0QN13_CHEAB